MDEGAASAGELDAPRWENLSIFMVITASVWDETGLADAEVLLEDLEAFTGNVQRWFAKYCTVGTSVNINDNKKRGERGVKRASCCFNAMGRFSFWFSRFLGCCEAE